MVDDRHTYRIRYVLAPDQQTVHEAVLDVVDPDPQPGYGPSLGVIHRALRRSDPDRFGHIVDPGELVLLSARPA